MTSEWFARKWFKQFRNRDLRKNPRKPLNNWQNNFKLARKLPVSICKRSKIIMAQGMGTTQFEWKLENVQVSDSVVGSPKPNPSISPPCCNLRWEMDSVKKKTLFAVVPKWSSEKLPELELFKEKVMVTVWSCTARLIHYNF